MALLTGRNRLYLVMATLALALLLTAAWATLAGAQEQDSGEESAADSDSGVPYDGPSGIWVTGTGKASGEPDIAVVSLGVESLEDTAASARAAASSAMAKVMSALLRAGVDSKDIQTSYFSISPRYEWAEVERCEDDDGAKETDAEETPEDADGFTELSCYYVSERRLIGYSVSNQATVKIRKLSNSGKLIDQVAEAAGDLVRINGIRFDIDNPQPLQDQAMADAVADMKRNAQMLADLSGVKLGRLVYINEEAPYLPAQPLYGRAEAAFADTYAGETPLSGGGLEYGMTVRGVFLIAGEAEPEETPTP